MEQILNTGGVVIIDGVKSLLLLGALLILRTILVRLIGKIPGLHIEARRAWMVGIRNALVLVFIVGLIFIWAHELSTLAVSLVAVAVALVLATREILLCISGSILRMGSDAYALGDRIEIGGVRGRVLDQNMLATRVLEIGPGHTSQQYTGRTVVFPNSLLLSGPLINETNSQQYIMHVVKVPLKAEEDWQAAEHRLLDAAREECAPFVEEAHQYMKQLEGKEWFDAPSVDPRVILQIPEPGKIQLLLRIPVPAQRTQRVEQAVLRRFLSGFPVPQKK